MRVVLEGLQGDETPAELCRREDIASSMSYGSSKEFLEAGLKATCRRHGLARLASRRGERISRREAQTLKEAVADLTLKNELHSEKHGLRGSGRREHEIFHIKQRRRSSG